MTTTAGGLVTEVSRMLHGYSNTQDRITPLAKAITDSDTTFTVSFASGQSVGISTGPVEIDGEQLYVTAVDNNTGICTLADGFGRGYNSTTPTAHAAGASVASRPKFPRADIFRTMNEVIGGLYPQVHAVQTYQSVIQWPNNTYVISPTPEFVIDAQWRDPIGRWIACPSYVLDPFDGTFRLAPDGMIGQPLRVLYAAQPATFTSEADSFTVTGLPASCADLLTIGTAARMVPTMDIARAQNTSVEASQRAQLVPQFAGVSAAKYLEAKFQDRLKNEAESLRKRYRTRLVRTW